MYAAIHQKQDKNDKNQLDDNLIKNYLNRNQRQNSITNQTIKHDELKTSSTLVRSSSTNLSCVNMKSPLINLPSKLDAKQLPFKQCSISSDTLSRTSDTFKGAFKEKPGTFSNLSTLQKGDRLGKNEKLRNEKSIRKFYLDNKGNKIQVRNTIEDFLKEECVGIRREEDEDKNEESICSSILRDSSLNNETEWAKLPFYQ